MAGILVRGIWRIFKGHGHMNTFHPLPLHWVFGIYVWLLCMFINKFILGYLQLKAVIIGKKIWDFVIIVLIVFCLEL
jgi:hypothetical protein